MRVEHRVTSPEGDDFLFETFSPPKLKDQDVLKMVNGNVNLIHGLTNLIIDLSHRVSELEKLGQTGRDT